MNDIQDICAHHAEELRTVWDRNAELLTEIERLCAEIERLRGALITGASLLEMGCNNNDMAASMRRAAGEQEDAT